MSAFNKVIGYESIKSELQQICDMLHNKEVYDALGAKLPKGVLLYGEPGLGKTLLANCFLEECGLKTYTLRKTKGGNDFVDEITNTFLTAKENAPCVLLLDDMDKYPEECCEYGTEEEFVAVQAGVDEVKNSDVFIIATVNDIHCLPNSLTRAGRFDRRIEVQTPSCKDAMNIIKYYLSDKKVDKDINMDDLARMVNYNSCAELETILNEAAISAGFDRRDSIGMKDMVKAVLRMQYESPDDYTETSAEDLKMIALHEAGHLVVSEVLCPGSVGLASVRSRGRSERGGFIHTCKGHIRRPHIVLVGLGGKAAVELYHAETVASGCDDDLNKAAVLIRRGIEENATMGLGLFGFDRRFGAPSEHMQSSVETVAHTEMERYMLMARNILIKNRDFLEKTAAMLLEKETLLASDIAAIKEQVKITEVAV